MTAHPRPWVYIAALALSACAAPDTRQIETTPTGTVIRYHGGGNLPTVGAEMSSYPGPVCVVGICASGCTSVLTRQDVATTPDAEWWLHGVRVAGRQNGQTRLPPDIVRDLDLIVAGWYSTRPGLSERFLAGDLDGWLKLTGAEMNARHGVPLCEGEA